MRAQYSYLRDYLGEGRMHAASSATHTRQSVENERINSSRTQVRDDLVDVKVNSVSELMDNFVHMFGFHEPDRLQQFHDEISSLHSADVSQRAGWSSVQHLSYGLSKMMALNHMYLQQFMYVACMDL